MRLLLIVGLLLSPALSAGWLFGGDDDVEGVEAFEAELVPEGLVVASLQTGTVLGIHVEPGDEVTAGKPLVELDSTMSGYELALAQAELEAAEKSIEVARAELIHLSRNAETLRLALKRTQEQRKRIAVTQWELIYAESQYHTAQAAEEAARAGVGSAEAALLLAEARTQLAEQRVSAMIIRAPVAGVIYEVSSKPGEVVEAGAPLVRLSLPGNFVAKLTLGSDLLGGLKPGDEARVNVGNKQMLEGIVSSIAFCRCQDQQSAAEGMGRIVGVKFGMNSSQFLARQKVTVYLRKSPETVWPARLSLSQ